VREPRKGWQTRGSPANLFASKTLGGSSGSSVRGRCEARERIGPGLASGGEGEPPRGEEPHEGLGPSAGLNRHRRVRTLAGIKALKWRAGREGVFRSTPPLTGTNCPQAVGSQREARKAHLSGSTTRGQGCPRGHSALRVGSTLKGRTPRAAPAWNKAGRWRAEQGLESVRNAEEATEPRAGTPGRSGCPPPGRRRRGRNRKGGSRRKAQVVRWRRPDDHTLEGSERLREFLPVDVRLFGLAIGRRPQRSAVRPRP
jgi:hypothetical protein